MDTWTQRQDAARAFWHEYVAAARAGYGLEFDPSDEMRVAMNEWFAKIDHATEEANATGCVLFNCTSTRKNPETVRLVF